jgi:hypothetical protein
MIAGSVVSPAAAQSSFPAGVEVATEEARRGISWSQGRAALSADVAAVLGPLDASARVVMTRGSERHGDADVVADLTIGTRWELGPVQLHPAVTAHLFSGARGDLDYVEVSTSGSFTYGPVQVIGGAAFAPSQDAIGGDNLYLHAGATAGLPGTPFTVAAELGHSSGNSKNPVLAQRLRPGGDYTNWRLGVERRRGPLTLAVEYIGTDLKRADANGPFADARNAGDRIVGRARLDF